MASFRFLFLADCQLGAYATFSGMTSAQIAEYAEKDMKVQQVPFVEGHEWDARRYEDAVAAANRLRPDFVVIGGDMVDNPDSAEQRQEFFRITGLLDHEVPIRWVPGNHDCGADTVVPTAESLAGYRRAFGEDYYTFRHGNAFFLALNTVVADHPEEVPKEWDDQWTFIRASLVEAREKRHSPIIVLGHHPLFLKDLHEPDTYWNLPAERRLPMLELFHRHDVTVAFAGHWHRNSITRDGEFEMVTSGPVGYPLGDDPSGYRIVEVVDDRVEHTYRALDEGHSGG